jgi:hypothetical protein
MKSISLNGAWRLCGRPEGDEAARIISLEATVPGEVQLDLSKAGYLPSDLFMGENIIEAEKYEGYEWWYEKSFTAPKSNHHTECGRKSSSAKGGVKQDDS